MELQPFSYSAISDFQRSLADVLSRNKLFLNHPASQELGDDLYCSVNNAEVQVAKRHRFTGKIKVSSNSLSLQGVSTFQIDPGVILGNLYVYGRFNNLPIHCQAGDGWAYKLIKSVEFKCSGSSSIQNLKVTGQSMFDMIMATTNSQDKRTQLLRLGGKEFANQAVSTDQDFCIPIYMLFSSADGRNVFPFDSATIRSQISISIEWNPLYYVISGQTTSPTNYAVTLPTSFDSLFLRVHNSVELEERYVANAMQRNPSLTYSIPVSYYQSFATSVNVASLADEIQVVLTSFPVGMLQCIIFSLSPQAWRGTSNTLTWINSTLSAPLEYLRVLYNGQVMYETNSDTENEFVSCVMDDGSASLLQAQNYDAIETSTQQFNNYKSALNIIPFANEISRVLRDRQHENTASYSGSSIQVFFQLSQTGMMFENGDTGRDDVLALPTGLYDLNFTYVLNALVEVNQGTMSLQLE